MMSSEGIELEIVIPTFNRANRLRSQLVTLRGLAASYPFRVTVIDNGSTDETAAVAGEFSDLPGFRYIAAGVNGGISRNIVRCFEETEGNWVWTLSDDNPVKADDVSIILEAIRSGRAEIYTFKTLGNHIHKTMVCSSGEEFLNHQEFLTLGFLSATVYSRRSIRAGLHLLAPSAYTLLPHCLLVFAALNKGCRIEFNTQQLCENFDAEKRISRKEFALGCIVCLEFFQDEVCQTLLARQLRANTRWMLVSALAQTKSARDIAEWKKVCRIVNTTLAIRGGGFWKCLTGRSWHAKADWRREVLIFIFLPCPSSLLLWLGEKLSRRTEQNKELTLFDNSI